MMLASANPTRILLVVGTLLTSTSAVLYDTVCIRTEWTALNCCNATICDLDITSCERAYPGPPPSPLPPPSPPPSPSPPPPTPCEITWLIVNIRNIGDVTWWLKLEDSYDFWPVWGWGRSETRGRLTIPHPAVYKFKVTWRNQGWENGEFWIAGNHVQNIDPDKSNSGSYETTFYVECPDQTYSQYSYG